MILFINPSKRFEDFILPVEIGYFVIAARGHLRRFIRLLTSRRCPTHAARNGKFYEAKFIERAAAI
jgi:hypothetical protein